jgi:hypothetical protein
VEARFVKPSDPETVVGAARWADGRVTTTAEQDDVAAALRRIFRALPVLSEDPALRSFGTSGPVVLEPGSVPWFVAAARVRAPGEGLGVRFAAEPNTGMGWDPAGAYRPFQAVVERLADP